MLGLWDWYCRRSFDAQDYADFDLQIEVALPMAATVEDGERPKEKPRPERVC